HRHAPAKPDFVAAELPGRSRESDFAVHRAAGRRPAVLPRADSAVASVTQRSEVRGQKAFELCLLRLCFSLAPSPRCRLSLPLSPAPAATLVSVPTIPRFSYRLP